MRLSTVVCIAGVFASAAQAAPEASGDVVIHTRDGKTRMGRILSETSRGYLLKTPDGTEVVPFEQIDDLKRLESAPAALSPPPPPPPSPGVASAEGAPEGRVDAVADAPVRERDWLSDRKGFRFGLGASAFGYPTGGYRPSVVGLATGLFHFNIGFGRVDLRFTPQLLGLFSSFGGSVFTAVDAQVRINFTRVYSLGVGTFQTLLFGAYSPIVLFGPSLAPVVLKLGERGSHELTAWVAIPVPVTYAYSYATLPLVTVGYSYLF